MGGSYCTTGVWLVPEGVSLKIEGILSIPCTA